MGSRQSSTNGYETTRRSSSLGRDWRFSLEESQPNVDSKPAFKRKTVNSSVITPLQKWHLSEEAAREAAAGDKSREELLLQVFAAFHSFDVRRATCFKAEERKRLLSVIATSFGSLDDFNDHVRSLIGVTFGIHGKAAAVQAAVPSTLSDASTAWREGLIEEVALLQQRATSKLRGDQTLRKSTSRKKSLANCYASKSFIGSMSSAGAMLPSITRAKRNSDIDLEAGTELPRATFGDESSFVFDGTALPRSRVRARRISYQEGGAQSFSVRRRFRRLSFQERETSTSARQEDPCVQSRHEDVRTIPPSLSVNSLTEAERAQDTQQSDPHTSTSNLRSDVGEVSPGTFEEAEGERAHGAQQNDPHASTSNLISDGGKPSPNSLEEAERAQDAQLGYPHACTSSQTSDRGEPFPSRVIQIHE